MDHVVLRADEFRLAEALGQFEGALECRGRPGLIPLPEPFPGDADEGPGVLGRRLPLAALPGMEPPSGHEAEGFPMVAGHVHEGDVFDEQVVPFFHAVEVALEEGEPLGRRPADPLVELVELEEDPGVAFVQGEGGFEFPSRPRGVGELVEAGQGEVPVDCRETGIEPLGGLPERNRTVVAALVVEEAAQVVGGPGVLGGGFHGPFEDRYHREAVREAVVGRSLFREAEETRRLGPPPFPTRKPGVPGRRVEELGQDAGAEGRPALPALGYAPFGDEQGVVPEARGRVGERKLEGRVGVRPRISREGRLLGPGLLLPSQGAEDEDLLPPGRDREDVVGEVLRYEDEGAIEQARGLLCILEGEGSQN